MNAALIISLSVFVSMMLFFYGIAHMCESRRKGKQIVEKIRSTEERLVLDKENEYAGSENKNSGSSFSRLINSLGRQVKPKDEKAVSGLRMKLMQAGYRRHNAAVVYYGYKVFCAALFAALFFFGKIFLVKSIQPGALMAIAIAFAVVGFYLPTLWLKIKIAQRQEKIFEGFPDALDLMVVCVEAGMGLDATINRVGEEMRLRNKVVSDEFRLMGLELRAGKLRQDALRNLGLRTGMDDVKSLMTLLIQTDKFGTSIAQALRVHSDSMRTKRYQKAEELAAKLPVKLVFPLVLFILPALFVVVVGPAAIRVFRILMPVLGGN